MAENGQGSGGGDAPGGSGQSQGLNHEPGSFAHNNSDQLPGESTKSFENSPNLRAEFDKARDPMIARQIDDLNKTEAERRNELTGQTPPSPKKARQSHAPKPAPTTRPSNAYPIDRGSFAARQRDEDQQARKEQFVASRRANMAQSNARVRSPDKQSFKEQFQRAAAKDNSQGHTR